MRKTRLSENYFLLAFMILIILILTGIVIWMGLSNPKSSTVEPTLPSLVQSRAKVSSDHSTFAVVTGQFIEIRPGDVLVKVPFEATSVEGFVSIIQRESDMFPDAGEPGWNRPKIVNVEFLDSIGQQIREFEFDKPIEICFVLDNVIWQEFIHNRNDYQIQFYDENPSDWKTLPQSMNYNQHELCGMSRQLSLIALAVRGEIQSTGTPTKIYEP